MTEDEARLRVIAAMCPERVCRTCGEPSVRIREKTEEYAAFRAQKMAGVSRVTAWAENVGKRGVTSWDQADDSGARGQLYETVGFTDCGHDDWRPGVWIDPFAESG